MSTGEDLPQKPQPPQPLQSRLSKFTEEFDPSPALLSHPRSVALSSQCQETHRPSDSRNAVQECTPCSEKEIAVANFENPVCTRLIKIEERMAAGSSLLGTQDDEELFSLKRFEGWITGHMDETYLDDTENFRAADHLFKEATKQAEEDYATLWLDVQFFWDMMLRMQPNSITDDLANTAAAVDFMMDGMAARVALDMHEECTTEVARLQIREFRRRLQRLQLFLRSTVGTCGKGPKMLCGCLVETKQYQDKERMWAKSPIWDHEPDESLFRVRDIARMLRLEDFVVHEAESNGRESDDCVFLVLNRGFFDEQVRRFLPKGETETVPDMRRAWLKALCDPQLRKLVVLEVQEMIKEAVDFRKQKGCNSHRKECEHYSVSKPKASCVSKIPGARREFACRK